MPCTSCTTSPCRTGLGGLLTSSWCLEDTGRLHGAAPGDKGPGCSPRGPAQPGGRPAHGHLS